MKTSFDFAAPAELHAMHYVPAGMQTGAREHESRPITERDAFASRPTPKTLPERDALASRPITERDASADREYDCDLVEEESALAAIHARATASANDACEVPQTLKDASTSESSTAVACASPATTSANAPRFGLFASANVALAMSVAAIAARWFVHTWWACALVSLSPLWLLLWREQRAVRSLYAGVLWLALAWVRLVHPKPEIDGSLQDLLSLCVLALVLLSLRHAYTGMQELSRRDPLTGLLNRRGFEELGKVEVLRATRYSRPIAFALLDVDRFKEINDNFGHAVGDRVLQLIAAQLRELRKSDLAVRLGGDEFGLLMPETDQAGAEILVARLMQRVQERVQEQGWSVTMSAGIADSRSRARHMDALMAEADRRMYDIKAIKQTGAARNA